MWGMRKGISECGRRHSADTAEKQGNTVSKNANVLAHTALGAHFT